MELSSVEESYLCEFGLLPDMISDLLELRFDGVILGADLDSDVPRRCHRFDRVSELDRAFLVGWFRCGHELHVGRNGEMDLRWREHRMCDHLADGVINGSLGTIGWSLHGLEDRCGDRIDDGLSIDNGCYTNDDGNASVADLLSMGPGLDGPTRDDGCLHGRRKDPSSIIVDHAVDDDLRRPSRELV